MFQVRHNTGPKVKDVDVNNICLNFKGFVG